MQKDHLLKKQKRILENNKLTDDILVDTTDKLEKKNKSLCQHKKDDKIIEIENDNLMWIIDKNIQNEKENFNRNREDCVNL